MVFPLLIELNTRCWLKKLSLEEGTDITLANVPEKVIHFWEASGFTHVWAMGVWTTGEQSRRFALNDPVTCGKLNEILPGWTEQDVPGSPYAIAAYSVPESLGGEKGLKKFRSRLNKLGIKLLLDFVPNHFALDHPWVKEKPELFVYAEEPFDGAFSVDANGKKVWIAHGKDPYFAPWRDVVQLDYRNSQTRHEMKQILKSLATKCDGVRCDMAMLALNEIFERTWEGKGNGHHKTDGEFWIDAIARTKTLNPEFVFLAESYWGTSEKLQSLGFDFTFHKETRDLLIHGQGAELPGHLRQKPVHELERSAHFLENHDEPRVTPLLDAQRHRMAAAAVFCLPGMRMLYEGQTNGSKIHLPVQAGRWPDEPIDGSLNEFYGTLFGALKYSSVGKGEWRLIEPEGWPDNQSCKNLIVVEWRNGAETFDLVVINCDANPAQAKVRPQFKVEHKNIEWRMEDMLGSERYLRQQLEMEMDGLFLGVAGYAAHLFHFSKV